MPDAYATVEQFRALIGTLRLSDMMNLPEEGEAAGLEDRLLTGAAEMNSAFARAGYAVPLELDLIEDPALKSQVEAQLATWNGVLAAWSAVGGIADASSGLKVAHDAWKEWKKGLLEGREVILGLAKEGQAALVGGRFGVVLFEDDLDVQARTMDRWNRLGTFA